MLRVEEVLRWQAAWFAGHVKAVNTLFSNTVFICEVRVMYIIYGLIVLGVFKVIYVVPVHYSMSAYCPKKAEQQKIPEGSTQQDR